MRFSILMCAYNSADTIRDAIDSCLVQDHEDWELLILDNDSPDDSKSIIDEYVKRDSRVKYFYSEKNVGFAKGISILLEHVTGEYMCFLAADDYLVTRRALSLVKEAADEDDPSIVFVRHVLTNKGEGKYVPREENCNVINLKSDNAMYMLSWLTKNWFFHSMFHFVSISFVRENGIDFFEPYYGDNEGMTEAVLRSKSVCCLDDCLYALTVNTSQTRGKIRMDHSLLKNMRYDSVRKYIIETGYFVEAQVATTVHHIMMMHYDYLGGLCSGAVTIDNYMNKIEATDYDRYKFTEKALSTRVWNEAEILSDDLTDEREKAFLSIAEHCLRMAEEGYDTTDDDWLMNLVIGGYEIIDGCVRKKTAFSEADLSHLKRGLMSADNSYCYGFDLFFDMMNGFDEETSYAVCNRYCMRRKELLDVLIEIKDAMKKKDRADTIEYARLLGRYKDEIEEMRFFLTESEVNDMLEKRSETW